MRKTWYNPYCSKYLIMQQKKIENFVAFTDGTKTEAREMLEDSDWDLLVS